MTPRRTSIAVFAALVALMAAAIVYSQATFEPTSPACSHEGPHCVIDSTIPPPGFAAPTAIDAQRGIAFAPPSIVGSNGDLPTSELAPATGGHAGPDPGQGQLANAPAAAWNALAVKAHAATGQWLDSNGPDSMYRPLARQVFWRDYWCGHGNCGNAAVPGTSNHGLGYAVDAPPATRALIESFGAPFGWRFACSDAPWESWHVKWCGGWSGTDPGPFGAAPFNPLKRGDGGKRVAHLNCQWRHLHRPPHGAQYQHHKTDHYGPGVERATRHFQLDHKLAVDGVVGPKTHDAIRHRWQRWSKTHKAACG